MRMIMNKTYEAPRIVEVFDASAVIQGGKQGALGDNNDSILPVTTPGYPADE